MTEGERDIYIHCFVLLSLHASHFHIHHIYYTIRLINFILFILSFLTVFADRYRFSEDDESGWKTMRVQPPDSKAFSIYNLQPNTDYEFQVFATNQLGRGPASDIVRAKTTDNKAELKTESNESGKCHDFFTILQPHSLFGCSIFSLVN